MVSPYVVLASTNSAWGRTEGGSVYHACLVMTCWLEREEEEALKRSKEIDELLVADGREKHQIDSKTVKVLLLGQAESGKSTTLKSMLSSLLD